MIEDLSELQIIQVITTIVQKYGCQILEMDLEKQVINIDGPLDAKEKCAFELSQFLE